ncbi:hypothetical protein ACYZUD_16755 [Pseudomonas sp. XS1P51]
MFKSRLSCDKGPVSPTSPDASEVLPDRGSSMLLIAAPDSEY